VGQPREEEESAMNATTIGLDIAKSIFQIHGVDGSGRRVLRKQLRRHDVLAFFANLPSALVGIEACSGSNYWARELRNLGHDARLISPQFVKPYVKGNKNDANDAEAICEAVSRPSMRFVPLKSAEQEGLQMLHRVRESLVKQRTALGNQMRGFLCEHGIVVPQRLSQLRARLPEILEDAENGLSELAREVFYEGYQRLCELDRQIGGYDEKIQTVYRQSPICQKLKKIPGIGPIIATAMVAAIGDARNFASGRQLAAWLGIVPGQDSSGGKQRLLGISKRGDTYLRKQMIHGGRAVVKAAAKKDDAQSRWVNELVKRRNANIAAVAVANKNARVIWALLSRNVDYRVAQ
jgi:transposase